MSSNKSSIPYTIQILPDTLDTAGDYVYVGRAYPGSSVNDPVWQVQRVPAPASPLTTYACAYANGNAYFCNVFTQAALNANTYN